MDLTRGRVIKPGDPEFDEIAKQVTHVSQIREELWPRNTFYVEADPFIKPKRRHENVNEL